jgi:hypothetical protein
MARKKKDAATIEMELGPEDWTRITMPRWACAVCGRHPEPGETVCPPPCGFALIPPSDALSQSSYDLSR